MTATKKSGSRKAATLKLAEIILRKQKDFEAKALQKLCDRLNIDNSLPENLRYELVGRQLSQKELEFKGRKIGRPKKAVEGQLDIRRAMVIKSCMELHETQQGKRLTQVDLIEIARQTEPKLWRLCT